MTFYTVNQNEYTGGFDEVMLSHRKTALEDREIRA